MAQSTVLGLLQDRVGPGDHLCSFYETKAEQFQTVLRFVWKGLARHGKCLFVADGKNTTEIRGEAEHTL